MCVCVCVCARVHVCVCVSIQCIVAPKSRSRCDFEIFLHLPQYKLSGRITQLFTSSEVDIKLVCLSDNNNIQIS